MSNPILEKMALRYKGELVRVIFTNTGTDKASETAMRAALLWLADNVSDEMANAWTKCDLEPGKATHGVISAALRAAAGGGDK